LLERHCHPFGSFVLLNPKYVIRFFHKIPSLMELVEKVAEFISNPRVAEWNRDRFASLHHNRGSTAIVLQNKVSVWRRLYILPF